MIEAKKLTEEKEQLKKENLSMVNRLINQAFNEDQRRELERKMNDLLSDEKKKLLRLACYEFVKERIMLRVEKRLNKTKDAMKDAFIPGDKNTFNKMVDILMKEEFLNLNKKDATVLAKEYACNMIAPTENAELNASESLKETLIKKEFVVFQKELCTKDENNNFFTKSAWWKFSHGVNYTKDETLKYIAKKLGLDALEEKAFLNLNIPECFAVNETVSKHVNELIRNLEPPITTSDEFLDFCEKVDISYDTWQKFNVNISQKTKTSSKSFTPEKIRHYEMLKVIATFRMESVEAENFMAEANRNFAMVMDLAFLTAITTGYEIIQRGHNTYYETLAQHGIDNKHPFYVALITHYLSSGLLTLVEGYPSYPKFTSPYKFKYIQEFGDI